MGKYKAQWRYASSYGSFNEGDVVELTDELAEAINRDSPGVLREAAKAQRKAAAKRAPRKPKADRMAKAEPEGGVMTRENFAAVKDKA